MPQSRDVVAAGVVVFRTGREVLLVHRPRYDDWSFPKGKLDPGEHAAVAAVREVWEETGLHVRLGPRLGDQRYPVNGDRHKLVHYWVGWCVSDDDVSDYEPNHEIDDVRWVPYDEALELLTYDRDREKLAEAKKLRKRTRALVVLRHAKARSRKSWSSRKPDTERPLVELGHDQSQRLVGVLAAYDVTRVVSSSSRRCVQTVQPFAETTEWELETRGRLAEEGASPEKVAKLVTQLLDDPASVVVCTHRPVLPSIWAALDLPDEKLDPAGLAIVHHRKGRIVATEVYQRP